MLNWYNLQNIGKYLKISILKNVCVQNISNKITTSESNSAIGSTNSNPGSIVESDQFG